MDQTEYKKSLRAAVEKYIKENGDVFENGADWDMSDIDMMAMEMNSELGFSIDMTTNGQDTRNAYMAVTYQSGAINYRIEIGELSSYINDLDSFIEECASIKNEIDSLEAKLSVISSNA